MIYDELSKYLPDLWERLVVYLEHGEYSYAYSFYVKEQGKYVKCFDIEDISEEELYKSFVTIEKEISDEGSRQKGELWSNMTMVVESNGKMKTDFDYTDLSIGNYRYKKKW